MSVSNFVSVIVPTHNRRSSIIRLLAALADQDHPLDRLEVIVVADGCADDTAEVLGRYRGPLDLRVIEQPGTGPAAARNAGAAVAKGACLLFLDDDVVPARCLVSAHREAHRRSPGSVVIGPYPPAHVGASLLELTVQSWWHKTFDNLLQPGWRHSFVSVLTGNLSIAADLLARVGGFDPRYRAHEDYELGIRLIRAGVPIVYEPDALAYHHYSSEIRAYIKRKADEGRADVMLLEQYPELATEMPLSRLMRSTAWDDRVVRWCAVHRLLSAGILERMLVGLLIALDRIGLREPWRNLKGWLECYTYLQAAADRLGGARPFMSFHRSLESRHQRDELLLELDVGRGLAAAEAELDRLRPAGVRLRYHSEDIGIIPPRPGAEPLRGAHLRPILAREMAAPLLEAMAQHGAVVDGSTEQRQAIRDAIQSHRRWFGASRHEWFEQYHQWRQFEQPSPTARARPARHGKRGILGCAASWSVTTVFYITRRPFVDAGALVMGLVLVPGLRISLTQLVFLGPVFALSTAAARPLMPYVTLPIVLPAVVAMRILLNSGLVWLTLQAGRALGFELESPTALSTVLVACVIGVVQLTTVAARDLGLRAGLRFWQSIKPRTRGQEP